jgi:hypothetical protein
MSTNMPYKLNQANLGYNLSKHAKKENVTHIKQKKQTLSG